MDKIDKLELERLKRQWDFLKKTGIDVYRPNHAFAACNEYCYKDLFRFICQHFHNYGDYLDGKEELKCF